MNNLYINKVSIQGGSDSQYYPYNLEIIKNFNGITFTKPITFFIGENGSGKSTIMESIAITYGFNAEGGSKNIRFSTNNTHSDLNEKMIISRGIIKPKDGFFLRSESFYNMASAIDEIGSGIHESYGGNSLHTVSHGESLLALINNRFYGNGIYILDEPEASLSIIGQFTLLRVINDLAQNHNSQFIIATHSPILLACHESVILEFKGDNISEIAYKMTQQYNLTKRFLNDDTFLIELLSDNEE